MQHGNSSSGATPPASTQALILVVCHLVWTLAHGRMQDAVHR